MASSRLMPIRLAKMSKSSSIWVAISSSVMPQMVAYSGNMLMFWILFSSLKILSCENLVIPVRKTKRR